MLNSADKDLGTSALQRISRAQELNYRQRFDLSASALVDGGYTLDLFTSAQDAFPTIIGRVRVSFVSPLMASYWRIGLLFNSNFYHQTRDLDFTTGEDPSLLTGGRNGLLPVESQTGEFECAYVVKEGTAVKLSFVPVVIPHVNAAMNPVGTVYLWGGKMMGGRS